MESARTHRTIYSLCRGSGGVLLALLATAALLAPLPTRAWHSNQVDWDANFGTNAYRCYDCHTLNGQTAGEGVVNTSFIAYSSRTMPLILAYSSGGTAPTNLGCTYCHNTPGNTKMKDALSHFGAKTSKHPVGVTWQTGFLNAGTENNREYLSSASPNIAGPSDLELDCVDCHDAALVAPGGYYMSHSAIPAGNPFLLKSVSVNHEYDALCRTCHGGTATFKGQNIRVTSHADASAATIQENDLTLLKTSSGLNQCTKCHDTHYSAKVKLFNDGHEGDTAIVSTNCTQVCHYDGDQYDNYTSHGHGRTLSTYKYKGGVVDFTTGSNYISIGMACTSCHGSLDTSDTSTLRKPHVENPSTGNLQNDFKVKFNLDLSVQAFDSGSVYGNPSSGVCYSCHSTYEQHAGTGGEPIGCQDCHDEHAEGSGSTSNYFMIPEVAKKQGSFTTTPPTGLRAKPGTEQIIYNMPRRNPTSGALNTGVEDFYSSGGTGMCDSTECHQAAGYAPLPFGTHTGGTLSTGMDCAGCHKHTGDPEGGWRASASCASCHSYPGASTAESDHILSSVHNKHVEAPPAGYGLKCEVCHYGYSAGHNLVSGYVDNQASGWTDATVLPANIKVRFDTSTGPNAGLTTLTYNTFEADSAAASGISGHNGVCAGLVCHGNASTKQSDWAGANETPNWGGTALGCGDCHANPPATPATNSAHVDHAAGYACGECHASETATTHVNGTVTLAAGLTYSGGLVLGDNNYGTCTTGSCHNVTTNIAWNVAATNCNQCHYTTSQPASEDNFVGNDQTRSLVYAVEWTGYGHGKVAPASPVINLACTVCHDMAASHDFTPGLTGSNPYQLTTGFSCSNFTNGCHTSTKSGPVTGLGLNTIKNHTLAEMGADGKRTWHFTPECVNCHDPHGDGRNIAMIGNEIFDAATFAFGPASGTSAENTALVFTNVTAFQDASGTSYAESDATPAPGYSAICQECHVATGPSPIVSYRDNTNTSFTGHPGATGNNPGDCGGCHKHNEAFKPSGCSGCHGGATVVGSNANYWPDGASGDDETGKHAQHITDMALRIYNENITNLLTDNGNGAADVKQKKLCAYCHEDPQGGNFAGGLNLHNDLSTNVTGYIHPLWQPYSTDFTSSDGNAVYNPRATDTCVNVDCHNNKTTTAGTYGWYNAGTSACLMCHTPGDLPGDDAGTAADNPTNIADPTSGLHRNSNSPWPSPSNPTVSGVAHDDSFTTPTATCVTCHTSVPAIGFGSAHVNGTFAANNATTVNEYYTFATYTDAATNAGYCAGSGVSGSGCHDGAGDAGSWTRQWTSDAYLSTGSVTNATSECNGCHGTWASGWNTGTSPNHNAAALNATGNHEECKMCHVYPDAAYGALAPFGSTNHGDGSITMNSAPTVAYNTTSNWCTGGVCHGGDTSHDMPGDSGWTAELLSGPAASCLGCHNTGGVGVGGTGNRRAVTAEFSLASHHVNGAVSGDDCADCHNNATHKSGTVKLWTNYPGTVSMNFPTGTQAAQNLKLYTVNNHCLACHGTTIVAPFSDGLNSNYKSWTAAKAQIGPRWTTGTTAGTDSVKFGKYDSATFNVTPADLVNKAFSPHYWTTGNQRGIATTGAWANDANAQAPMSDNGTVAGTVACLDCHNSHGSDKYSVRSWSESGGYTGNVGMFISSAGRWHNNGSNYYTPTAGSYYSAEADLCFDCHTQTSNGTDSATAHYKNYQKFGLTNPIAAYYDGLATGRWAKATSWTGSFTRTGGWASNAYKPQSLLGGHFDRATSYADGVTGTVAASWASANIGGANGPKALSGQCSGCHDPHGIDKAGTTEENYRLPALKGTWITSPYKEDRRGWDQNVAGGAAGDPYFYTPSGSTTLSLGAAPRKNTDLPYNKPPITGKGYGSSGGGTGNDGYFIDINTFGRNTWTYGAVATAKKFTTVADVHSNTNVAYNRYGGLCATCHVQAGLAQGTTAAPYNGDSVDVHRVAPGTSATDNVVGQASWLDLLINYNRANSRVDRGTNATAMHAVSNLTYTGGDTAPTHMGHGNATSIVSKFLVAGASSTGRSAGYRWDVSQATSTQTNYHRFPCSKCHTPHVAALPRLMVTNCLETSMNSNEFRRAKYGTSASITTTFPSTRAVTCHSEDWESIRWNNVTPWNDNYWTPTVPCPTSSTNGTMYNWR